MGFLFWILVYHHIITCLMKRKKKKRYEPKKVSITFQSNFHICKIQLNLITIKEDHSYKKIKILLKIFRRDYTNLQIRDLTKENCNKFKIHRKITINPNTKRKCNHSSSALFLHAKSSTMSFNCSFSSTTL